MHTQEECICIFYTTRIYEFFCRSHVSVCAFSLLGFYSPVFPVPAIVVLKTIEIKAGWYVFVIPVQTNRRNSLYALYVHSQSRELSDGFFKSERHCVVIGLDIYGIIIAVCIASTENISVRGRGSRDSGFEGPSSPDGVVSHMRPASPGGTGLLIVRWDDTLERADTLGGRGDTDTTGKVDRRLYIVRESTGASMIEGGAGRLNCADVPDLDVCDSLSMRYDMRRGRRGAADFSVINVMRSRLSCAI